VKRHGAQYWLVIVTGTPDGMTFAVPAHYWSAVWHPKQSGPLEDPPTASWVKERGIQDARDALAIAKGIAELWSRATSTHLSAAILESLGEDLLDTGRAPAAHGTESADVGAAVVGIGIGVALALAAGSGRSTQPSRTWDCTPFPLRELFSDRSVEALLARGFTLTDTMSFVTVRPAKEWIATIGDRVLGRIERSRIGGGWWTVLPSAEGEVEELCHTRRGVVEMLVRHATLPGTVGWGCAPVMVSLIFEHGDAARGLTPQHCVSFMEETPGEEWSAWVAGRALGRIRHGGSPGSGWWTVHPHPRDSGLGSVPELVHGRAAVVAKLLYAMPVASSA
jgi:hypothetical protein